MLQELCVLFKINGTIYFMWSFNAELYFKMSKDPSFWIPAIIMEITFELVYLWFLAVWSQLPTVNEIIFQVFRVPETATVLLRYCNNFLSFKVNTSRRNCFKSIQTFKQWRIQQFSYYQRVLCVKLHKQVLLPRLLVTNTQKYYKARTCMGAFYGHILGAW